MIADPLWSCVMLLRGPLWVFCGPLWSLAVFSHTLPTEARKGCTVMYTLQPQPREMKQSSELTVPTKQRPSSTKYFYFKAPSYFNCKDTLVVQRSYNTQRKQLNQNENAAV